MFSVLFGSIFKLLTCPHHVTDTVKSVKNVNREPSRYNLETRLQEYTCCQSSSIYEFITFPIFVSLIITFPIKSDFIWAIKIINFDQIKLDLTKLKLTNQKLSWCHRKVY